MTFTEFLKNEENEAVVYHIHHSFSDAGLSFPEPAELGAMVDKAAGFTAREAAEDLAVALDGAAIDFRGLAEKYKAETDDVDFIDGGDGPTPEPEFIEMTPEDDASIRGAA